MNMTNQEQATGKGTSAPCDNYTTLKASENPECVAGRTDTVRAPIREIGKAKTKRGGDMINVKATIGWRGSKPDGTGDRISIEWDNSLGHHYHIWLTSDPRMEEVLGSRSQFAKTGGIAKLLGGANAGAGGPARDYYVEKNVIYVNAPAGSSGTPAYFKTKYLDAAAKINHEMVINAWLLSSVEQAYIDFDAQQAEDAARREHARHAVILTVTDARGNEVLELDIRDIVLAENWDSMENLEVLKKINHATAVAIGLNAKK